MNDFIYYNPVKLFYGESQMENVLEELKSFGNRVLIILGGESFRKNGNYQPLIEAMKAAGLQHYELSGNRTPSLAIVRKGIELYRIEKIDAVVGIGGGACMDIAKAISFGVKQPGDVWEYLTYARKAETNEYLPVGTIPTFPSSGSDMNGATQITEDATGEQAGLSDVFPNFSWLNPQYVLPLPTTALVEGQITSFVQVSIAYIGLERSDLAENMALLLINHIRDNLQRLVKQPNNVQTRGNLMLSSALNVGGLTSLGKNGDWSLYPLEGIAQNYCGVGYRQAITVLFPYWVKACYSGQQVIKDYFVKAFGVATKGKSDEQILDDGLQALWAFYREYSLPTRFADIKELPDDLEKLRGCIAKVGEQPSIYTTFKIERIEKMLLESIHGIA